MIQYTSHAWCGSGRHAGPLHTFHSTGDRVGCQKGPSGDGHSGQPIAAAQAEHQVEGRPLLDAVA